MYGRIRTIVFVLLVVLATTDVCGFKLEKDNSPKVDKRFEVDKMTTNDIDVVFGEIDGDAECSLLRKYDEAGFSNLGRGQVDLCQYVFDKLLAVPVGTNMWGFSSRFNHKRMLLKGIVNVLGRNTTDDHLRKILLNAASTLPISTNEFTQLKRKAVQLDRRENPRTPKCASGPRPGRHFRHWCMIYTQATEWNKSVVDYRRLLVEFVCRKYEEIHADIPEKERRDNLKALLLEYGFTM